ncbi:transmembrane protein 198 [Penaeus vannamei]|uniref:transmembrane protein 198-like n=1 Tax=Penaeus monodon TaxID=6687 RepID=UPI0018A772AA|nr:transmembrane protein 198-like [Penaeus monodon]XP_047475395.1 transmembrane protein 198-like [Penaeus chinensis]
MSWLGGDDPGGGYGDDYPWWAPEDGHGARDNRTWEERCYTLDYDYHVVTAVICAMFLVFGVVYSLFGYRCFKAVMFLTGFIFASVVVYLICLSEDLLPLIGNAGVSLGAGVMFGLITMLVQYVGLFMTGLHTGLFLGVAGIAIAYKWWVPSSVWPVVGILLAAGLLLAITTLYFQKGLTILGTAISGGAIMSATLDYFIEKFLMVRWFEDRLKVVESEPPCWFSWMILGVWPFMVLVGSLTQWKITGRGIYHQQLVPSKKSRSVNLQRMRSREARAEMRQKKYRYLYQVRTAHGDIISQEYIQSLQRKAYPTGDNGTLQSDSTHTTMLPPEHTQLAPLTESEDETGGSQPPPTPPEPPRMTRVTMH